MNTEKTSTPHRSGKRSFRVSLKPEESALVNAAKRLRDVKTDRELLLSLCQNEMARHDHRASSSAVPQQDFLRSAMKRHGLSRIEFADRIGVKKRTLDNWLLPDSSRHSRKMPDHVRLVVGELLPF